MPGTGIRLIRRVTELESAWPMSTAGSSLSAGHLFAVGNFFLTLVFIFIIPIPAVFILGYWFLLQFLSGINALGASASGGVAVWAHVGGFLLGMLLTALVRRR